MQLDNKIVDNISTLILEKGDNLLNSKTRLENLLKDLCPYNQREVHVLINLLDLGLVKELLDDTQISDSFKNKWRVRISQQTALDKEAIEWAIDVWIKLLQSDDRHIKRNLLRLIVKYDEALKNISDLY